MVVTPNRFGASSPHDGMPEDAPDALLIIVRGHPRPQPRPRFAGGRVIGTADKKASVWRAAILRCARVSVRLRGNHGLVSDHGPVRGGVMVDVVFRFPTKDTTRHGQPHTGKPDGDNLAKLVLDVLVEAKALGGDDARCAALSVTKLWSCDNPGLTVLVRPMAAVDHRMPLPDCVPGWLSGKPPLAK